IPPPAGGVQAIAALAHVAGRKAQIHAHAGRQVDRARNASSTVRNMIASNPAPMRSRSPLVSASSRAVSVAGAGRCARALNALPPLIGLRSRPCLDAGFGHETT